VVVRAWRNGADYRRHGVDACIHSVNSGLLAAGGKVIAEVSDVNRESNTITLTITGEAAEDWDLDKFMLDPIIVKEHDYGLQDAVIGRVVSRSNVEGALRLAICFRFEYMLNFIAAPACKRKVIVEFGYKKEQNGRREVFEMSIHPVPFEKGES
jgi:hypothetical protein